MVKNLSSQISIAPAEIPLSSAGNCSTVVCRNLCLDNASARFVPTAMPGVAASISSAPTIVVCHPVAGQIALFASDGFLRYAMLDTTNPEAIAVAQLPASVYGAYSPDSLSVVLLSRSGRLCVNLDPDSGIPSLIDNVDAPPFAFRVDSQMQLPISIPAARLSGSYSTRSTQLIAADQRSLSTDLLQAYCNADADANAAGYRLQPILARYRLLDADGNTLYISNPTLLSASDGFQGSTPISASLSDDFTQRLACSSRLNVFRPAIVPCFDAYDKFPSAVSAMAIELSQPLCPVDFNSLAPNSISTVATNSVAVSFFIPGLSSGMSPSLARANAIVTGLLDYPDDAFSVVKTIRNPFSISSPVVIDASSEFHSSPQKQVATLQSLLASKPSVIDRALRLCSLPHTYTAATACIGPNILVAANLQASLFKGYMPQQFFASVSSDPFTAIVAVTFADDSTRLVAAASSSTGAPTSIAPLLFYPSPDAVKISISYLVGDVHYHFSAPLTPTRDGSAAFYLHPSLAPFTPDAVDSPFSIPAASSSTINLPAHLLISPLNNPSNPYCVIPQSNAKIISLTPADRGKASYNHSNMRFLAFSEAEISMITVSTKGVVIANEKIYYRGLNSSRLISNTTNPSFPTVALLDNQLVAINRQRIQPLFSPCSAIDLAWDPVSYRLCMLRSDNSIAVINLDNLSYHTIDADGTTALATSPKSLLISTPRGLLDTRRPNTAPGSTSQLQINFTPQLRLSNSHLKRLTRLCADIALSSKAPVSVALYGHDVANANPTLLTSITLDAIPASPFNIMRLPSRRFPAYSILISCPTANLQSIGSICAFFS
jgi:hypothetical protein